MNGKRGATSPAIEWILRPVAAPLPRIGNGEVAIWRIDLDASAWQEAGHLLDAEEHDRARRFAWEQLARRWKAGRVALRMLVGAYIERDAGSLAFDVGEAGKPALAAGTPPLHFNLSHSGPWGCIACSWTGPLGVDIEQADSRHDVAALVRRFFAADEIALVEHAPETEREAVAYRLWTAKEAKLKALGHGMAAGLAKVSVASLFVQEATLSSTESWRAFDVDSDVYGACVALVPVARFVFYSGTPQATR